MPYWQYKSIYFIIFNYYSLLFYIPKQPAPFQVNDVFFQKCERVFRFRLQCYISFQIYFHSICVTFSTKSSKTLFNYSLVFRKGDILINFHKHCVNFPSITLNLFVLDTIFIVKNIIGVVYIHIQLLMVVIKYFTSIVKFYNIRCSMNRPMSADSNYEEPSEEEVLEADLLRLKRSYTSLENEYKLFKEETRRKLLKQRSVI